MHKYLRLLRVEQWYKNIVAFAPLFFSGNLFNMPLAISSFWAFLTLCLTSSASYIVNDIKDREKDRTHPEKNTRPIASKEISVSSASAIALLLIIVSFTTSFIVSPLLLIANMLLLLSVLAYTIYLKKKAILDIHVISLNYIIRTVAGGIVIGVPISPWLLVTIFFLALFLAVGKRRGELSLLGKEAITDRSSYGVYTTNLLDMFSIVIVTTLLFSYSLYTFMVHDEVKIMMLTIPFASFMLFRYLYFMSIDHVILRNTHYLFKDRQMVTCLFAWVVTNYFVLYRFV